mgnify:FL=1
MSKYYSNKSDFSEAGSNLQSGGGGSTSSVNAYSNYVSGGYPSGGSSKSMSQLINDIEEVAKTVTSEGVADLYVQTGEAALNVTKNSDEFDKATTRVSKILKSAQKIHQNIMQNIDSKFTLGIDKVLEGLNKINGSESKYKTKNLTRTEHNYRPVNGNICAPTAYYDDKKEVPYSLSEILDGKASPIKAAKDVYGKRLEAVKESLKHKDKMTDEQLKQIKGKSAEEVLELMYPKEIPDYQKLKASRYYEEHRETLQKVDTGIKILAWAGAIGGVVLSPFTGGSSLALTYASTAYLTIDSGYSAVTGHTMITGDRLSTEERVWAGIDAASVVLSAGAGSYLMKLRKAGKAGSTLLKLASHADDVNDASKVVYAFATDKDPKAAIGNLVMGQVQGAAVNKAGGFLHGKFGKANAPDVPDIPTNSTKQHIEVDSSGLNSKKFKIDSTVVHQKKNTKLDLKIEPTVKADLASTPKPHVDVETSKIKPVEAVAGAATAVPKSKKPDIDVLTKSKDLSTIKGEAVDHVGTVKPKVDLDVPEAGDVLKVHEAEISPTKSEMKKGSKQKEVHVEDVEHYTTWDQMKAEHYRTVTEFVQANKPDGASHPREWLNKPNHEFTIEHMSDGTQVWKYTDSLGVEKVYVDGVLQGGGVPNPKVTQHFEQLNPRIKDFDPEVASTLQKSNAGEILADDNMRIVRENVGANGNTYTLESIGRPAPGGIDDPIVKGIDGIYKNQTPPPSYVINETKWGSSEINQETRTGPQMSEGWVTKRLGELSMMEQVKIQRAIKNGDVDFVISKVDTSGNVSTYYATSVTDSAGQVIRVKKGAVWP